MRALHELGEALERRWRDLDWNEAAFPALAAEALESRELHRALGWRDVLRWVLASDALPPQGELRDRFGDAPVTVFHGRRCFVQVLMWREGSTSIHRHGFSGAFQVLEGESLHTEYEFATERRVSSRMLLGALRATRTTLLPRGAVHPITTGLAHALYHLEPQAATVVVRTYREDDAHPQYAYRVGGVAIDPFYDDPVSTRQAQALRFLRAAEPEEALSLATALVARSDLHTGYLALSEMARGGDDLHPLLDALRARHGEAVSARLDAVVREERRERKVLALRARSEDRDERYLLALLANLHDREAVFAMVRARAPEADPRAWILQRLTPRLDVERLGVDLADPFTLDAIDALLRADTDAAALGQLADRYGRAALDAQRDAALRHLARLRRSALAPLFTPRGLPPG